jgi:hypothetical protein
MRQSKHPVVMGTVAREQRGSARRTCRRGVKCLPKENSFRRKLLQIRRRDIVSIRFYVSARVVRVQIKNVQSLSYYVRAGSQ